MMNTNVSRSQNPFWKQHCHSAHTDIASLLKKKVKKKWKVKPMFILMKWTKGFESLNKQRRMSTTVANTREEDLVKSKLAWVSDRRETISLAFHLRRWGLNPAWVAGRISPHASMRQYLYVTLHCIVSTAQLTVVHLMLFNEESICFTVWCIVKYIPVSFMFCLLTKYSSLLNLLMFHTAQVGHQDHHVCRDTSCKSPRYRDMYVPLQPYRSAIIPI